MKVKFVLEGLLLSLNQTSISATRHWTKCINKRQSHMQKTPILYCYYT